MSTRATPKITTRAKVTRETSVVHNRSGFGAVRGVSRCLCEALSICSCGGSLRETPSTRFRGGSRGTTIRTAAGSNGQAAQQQLA